MLDRSGVIEAVIVCLWLCTVIQRVDGRSGLWFKTVTVYQNCLWTEDHWWHVADFSRRYNALSSRWRTGCIFKLD